MAEETAETGNLKVNMGSHQGVPVVALEDGENARLIGCPEAREFALRIFEASVLACMSHAFIQCLQQKLGFTEEECKPELEKLIDYYFAIRDGRQPAPPGEAGPPAASPPEA